MSSISIDAAKSTYGGKNEKETVLNMAVATGCNRIYMYRNAYQKWWSRGRTDYFRVKNPGDDERLKASSYVRRIVLVYDHGTIRIPITRVLYTPLARITTYVLRPFSPLFAAPNIEELRDKKDIPSLIKALNHKRSATREAAAEVLGEIGDRGAVESLINTLQDENGDVRSSGARALGQLRAVEPLIAALKDEDQDVRVHVADALAAIGDSRARHPLSIALEVEKGLWARARLSHALAELNRRVNSA